MQVVARLRCFLPLAGLLFTATCPDAKAQLRFDPPTLVENRIRLSLRGETGSNYVIESSEDLSNWTFRSSGSATNGQLEFWHNDITSAPRRFYRARPGTGPTPPPKLALQLDTNRSVATLVSPNGGSCVLFGADGTRFTLTVPTNILATPQIITMTLATNVGGLPFARGTLGTVQLQPEDLNIFGAAALEITYPTNIDRRQIASFTSNNDGSDFHLTPDRVFSDHVLIPVTRFGTFGSSLVTTQELRGLAVLHGSMPPAAISKLGPAKPRPFALQNWPQSSEVCFRERIDAAIVVREAISKSKAAQDVAIAAQLAQARQNQVLGMTEDLPSIIAEAAAGACPFYESQIAPVWPEATNNCALHVVLLQFTLGFERQLKLLGVDDPSGCTDLANQPLCQGFETCLQEIKECCLQGVKGPGKNAEVFGLIQQQAFLGLTCFGPYDPKVQDVMETCSSNIWLGSFKATEKGSTNIVTTYPNGSSQTENYEYDVTFDGSVWTSEEFSFGSVGWSVNLVFRGNYSGRDFHSTYFQSSESCGPYSRLDLNKTIGNVFSQYLGYLSIQTNGNYGIFAGHNHSDSAPFAPAIDLEQMEEQRPNCTGDPVRKSHTQRRDSILFGPTLPHFLGAAAPYPKSISGSFTMPGFRPFVPTTITFTWNLWRYRVPP